MDEIKLLQFQDIRASSGLLCWERSQGGPFAVGQHVALVIAAVRPTPLLLMLLHQLRGPDLVARHLQPFDVLKWRNNVSLFCC